MSALTAQQTHPELREEVRTLLEATNAPRVARGEEPLDVEAEVDRPLARPRLTGFRRISAADADGRIRRVFVR